MHYPQLPDPTGWDVYAEYPMGLADNWTASDDGPVKYIHFWGSWRQDNVGQTGNIQVRIYDNDTSGPVAKPGDALWTNIFTPQQYTTRLYADDSEQGWYFPNLEGLPGAYTQNDHKQIWQFNIPVVPESFYQQQGQTYWLGIGGDFELEGAFCGWKTTLNPYSSSSVFWDGLAGDWVTLHDPVSGQPMDLAFVVEHLPEPGTICLLGLGAVALITKRKTR
jgi:hypothetical protein